MLQQSKEHGRTTIAWVTQRGRWWEVERTSLILCSILWLLIVSTGIYALLSGDAQISIQQALAALQGREQGLAQLVVVQWRAPRILLAIMLGAALAISGSIFQTLTHNALGSPDVIGFQTGSFTGALIVMLVLRGSSVMVMAGALVGGITTALIVLALSTRQKAARGVRLIIVGIGVSALLASVNTWLMLTATEEDALMAGLWGAGNFSGSTWGHVRLVFWGSALFFLGAILLGRHLSVLEIGVLFAQGVGLQVRRVQVLAIVVGIGLIALATATIGPVSFIALASPHIARKLVGGDGLLVGPCAAVGALLLLAADVLAQRIYPPSPLPVGIVTVSIGGLYFLWLLISEGKKK